MTYEFTEKDIKVITAALERHVATDDGVFFDVGLNCYGLRGKDYKRTLEKVRGEKEEIVCLDLMALYEHKIERYKKDGFPNTQEWDCVDTDYHIIRREKSPDSSDYFDLYRNAESCIKLCCDGEQCKVLERTDEYVKLIDVENIDNDEWGGIDTTFKLSVEEFKIATGGTK